MASKVLTASCGCGCDGVIPFVELTLFVEVSIGGGDQYRSGDNLNGWGGDDVAHGYVASVVPIPDDTVIYGYERYLAVQPDGEWGFARRGEPVVSFQMSSPRPAPWDDAWDPAGITGVFGAVAYSGWEDLPNGEWHNGITAGYYPNQQFVRAADSIEGDLP